jgi:hypothetical protein
MANTPTLTIRFPAKERAALERAAKAQDRPATALARKIIVEWLHDRKPEPIDTAISKLDELIRIIEREKRA